MEVIALINTVTAAAYSNCALSVPSQFPCHRTKNPNSMEKLDTLVRQEWFTMNELIVTANGKHVANP